MGGGSYYSSSSPSESVFLGKFWSGINSGSSEASIEGGRTRLLNRKREEFEPQLRSFEKRIKTEAKKVFNLFFEKLQFLTEMTGIVFNTEFVRNIFDDFLNGVSITEPVMERLSRTDAECLEILQQDAGEGRTNELEQFAVQNIQNILSKTMRNFEGTVKKALLLINDIAKNKISDVPQLERTLVNEIVKNKLPLQLLVKNKSTLTDQVELLKIFIESVELSTDNDREKCYAEFKTYYKANPVYYGTVCS
ncbi:hypothetical protein FACS189442_0360 [Spirochaetia bacterium]|nr:hypothetical protein FACS189442_0360 [Spirochaetia bacterium]